MKTPRQLVLVLGALLGVANIVSGASRLVTNSVNKRPATYHMVSAMQMHDTMKGKKRIIDWACYVDYGPTGTSGAPVSRTDAWLEGDFKDKADGVELWDVGAQHRTHQLLVRLVPKGSHTAVLKQVTDSMGKPLSPAVEPPKDGNGFYLVEGALPNGGASPVNSYVIETTDPTLHLDVLFVSHLPGSPGTKQTEDGGPPSLPPVNEN